MEYVICVITHKEYKMGARGIKEAKRAKEIKEMTGVTALGPAPMVKIGAHAPIKREKPLKNIKDIKNTQNIQNKKIKKKETNSMKGMKTMKGMKGIKSFREYIISEKKKGTIVEEVVIEVVDNGDFVVNIPLVLTIDDIDLYDYAQETGYDYGDEEDYLWTYNWEPYDKETTKLVKKYRVEKIIDKLIQGQQYSADDFKEQRNGIPPRFDKYKESTVQPWGYIDINDNDYGRI